MSVRMASLALLLLVLAGCSTAARRADPGPPPRSPTQIDMQCVDDCLGNGGNREFCEERCTN